MSTIEPTLFDMAPPPVPQQRKQAAEVLANLRRLEERLNGCTAWDLYLSWQSPAPHPPQQNVIARRLTDLHESGLIVKTGEDRQGGYGRTMTVWRSVG